MPLIIPESLIIQGHIHDYPEEVASSNHMPSMDSQSYKETYQLDSN